MLVHASFLPGRLRPDMGKVTLGKALSHGLGGRAGVGPWRQACPLQGRHFCLLTRPELRSWGKPCTSYSPAFLTSQVCGAVTERMDETFKFKISTLL